jgi:hypothetical protein
MINNLLVVSLAFCLGRAVLPLNIFYDLFVAAVALLLTGFFVNTALQEAHKLAALGE